MSATEKAKALDELVRRVIVPYICVGTVLIALGFFVRYSPLPEIDTEHESEELAVTNMSKKSILAFPHLVLGAIGIFLHVGTQVIAIDTIIGYANSMGIPLDGSKNISCIYIGRNHLRVYYRHHHHTKIYQPGYCVEDMHFTRHPVNIADHFYKRRNSFVGTYHRYLHLVRSIARPGQFIGMGRYLAAGPGFSWADLPNSALR
jgi:hypothetical protein